MGLGSLSAVPFRKPRRSEYGALQIVAVGLAHLIVALPKHLLKYDELVDLLVDAVVREIAAESPDEQAPRSSQTRTGDLSDENYPISGAP